eukprot:6210979-Alexandrium_andersonii.AAC.1
MAGSPARRRICSDGPEGPQQRDRNDSSSVNQRQANSSGLKQFHVTSRSFPQLPVASRSFQQLLATSVAAQLMHCTVRSEPEATRGPRGDW